MNQNECDSLYVAMDDLGVWVHLGIYYEEHRLRYMCGTISGKPSLPRISLEQTGTMPVKEARAVFGCQMFDADLFCALVNMGVDVVVALGICLS